MFLHPNRNTQTAYYKFLENKYFIEKDPIYKSIIMSVLSRTNHRMNIFGGPQDIEYFKCFDQWYEKKFLSCNFKNLKISYKRNFDHKKSFYIQYVPAKSTPEFEEIFENRYNISEFNEMENCLLICSYIFCVLVQF